MNLHRTAKKSKEGEEEVDCWKITHWKWQLENWLKSNQYHFKVRESVWWYSAAEVSCMDPNSVLKGLNPTLRFLCLPGSFTQSCCRSDKPTYVGTNLRDGGNDGAVTVVTQVNGGLKGHLYSFFFLLWMNKRCSRSRWVTYRAGLRWCSKIAAD